MVSRYSVWRKVLIAGLIFLLSAALSFGQVSFSTDQPDGGGTAPLPSYAISDSQREAIWANINKNRSRLESEGILQAVTPQVTLFKWPLAKAAG